MTKGNAPSRPRWPEAIKKEIEDKLATSKLLLSRTTECSKRFLTRLGKYLLVLQRIPNRNKTFPRTTCYVDEFCSHTPNESIPGSFRISLERKSLALSSNLGYQAMVCYSKATRSASYDRLVGIEKKGEQWYDLDCMEELWEEKVRRLTLQDTTPLPVIHPLTQIVKFIIPERRIIKKYPQAYALSSPLEYALNLWRAVYHWQCFVNDPDNQDMLRRLNGDVYPYENFPEGVYKARVGEALYFDLGMWEARGFARNGRFAELRWDEVRNRSLSAVMSMALKHEAEVEKLEVLPHLEEGMRRSVVASMLNITNTDFFKNMEQILLRPNLHEIFNASSKRRQKKLQLVCSRRQ